MDKTLLKRSEPRPMRKRDINNKTLYVIIGGGAAGAIACETLRAEGFGGRILVINRENHLPYDRTKLSKVMDTEASRILLRPDKFYNDYDIEFKLGVSVEKLDPESMTIELNNQEIIKYDQALIASGADCQRLRMIPGHDARNIYVLRTAEEARKIYMESEGKNVLVVGSSFIGMEVASCIIERCKSIIVIGMEKVPFERVLGLEIGSLMQKFHESKGVKFIMNATTKEFLKKNDEVVCVQLIDGTEINCDMIVLGAGVLPTTNFIKQSPLLKFGGEKSIIVDEFLYTGADGLWAAGDVARYPLALLDGTLVRIEHWGMAQTQAAIAAKNMIHGRKYQISTKIPYFWTVQYGKNIRYCGHALRYNDLIFDQFNDDVTKKEFGFVAYYILDDKVVGACSLNRDPIIAQVAEIMNAGKIISGSELKQAINSDINEIMTAGKISGSDTNTKLLIQKYLTG
jgi:NADPH-dependent 2,4-dienoyl-CoA reductase/sulfur reductase-like enzyme